MGKCVSFSVESIRHRERVFAADIPEKPHFEERTYEDTARFIRAAISNRVIGGRLKGFTDCRISDLSKRISVMLNYAFKYETITPFIDVLEMHTKMGITEDEVNSFIDLLLKTCYPNQSVWFPVQEKILEQIKMYILNGSENTVRISPEEWGTLTELPHFYRLISNHFLFTDLFEEITHNQMDKMVDMIDHVMKLGAKEETLKEITAKHKHLCISTIEYETFISVWLREFQKDALFVNRALPIIDKLRGYVVMEYEREVLDICHMIKVNQVLGRRFRKYKEHDLRSLIAKTIQSSRNQDQEKLEKVAMMYQPKLVDKELLELSQIFNLVCPDCKKMIQQLRR